VFRAKHITGLNYSQLNYSFPIFTFFTVVTILQFFKLRSTTEQMPALVYLKNWTFSDQNVIVEQLLDALGLSTSVEKPRRENVKVFDTEEDFCQRVSV
jgi:hypothetical protein